MSASAPRNSFIRYQFVDSLPGFLETHQEPFGISQLPPAAQTDRLMALGHAIAADGIEHSGAVEAVDDGVVKRRAEG